MVGRSYLSFATSVLFATPSAGSPLAQEAQAPTTSGWSQDEVLRIAKEVRKQMVTLPQYGVFDDIHFGIKGKTIILQGSASRPILKSSAENVVKKIERVEAVENQIEVLPLSPNDDRIRAGLRKNLRLPRAADIPRIGAAEGG